MKDRYAGNPSFVFGFHGCDREVGENVLAGKADLAESSNDYDWLGNGVYFWENNLDRAQLWAKQRMDMPNSTVREPYVVGAVIDLGFSLSLMQRDHLALLQIAFENLTDSFQKMGKPLPENSGGEDHFLRYLDCAVIQALHKEREKNDMPPFDTVRSLFQEGGHIYPGGSFREGNHIQICVRNRHCIKGYFRPMDF